VATPTQMTYTGGMNQPTRDILNRIETWPEEDQAELVEVAREIEARRTGVYDLSDDEKAAIKAALQSGIASEEEVAAFWKRVGVT
jgi:hypothetical protein